MTDNATEKRPAMWAIVEVMGHKLFAGLVTEEQIAGSGFVRVDVPGRDGRQAFTKYLSPSAIFALTPVDEATARAAAAGSGSAPVEAWRLLPALPGSDAEW